ncbi:MAG: LytS/YhcK type 5TM receptor domain-containing protein [Desulfomonilaceae bacterium]
MSLYLELFRTMSVFMVVGYLYCKSPWFRPLTNQNLDRRDKVYQYFFFSALSIMGTYLGQPVHGALANTRAIGPVLAGMIGGPFLGTAVGLTGGFHRYLQGGFTGFSCGLSTTAEGFLGGLVYLYLTRRNKLQKIFDPGIAFLTAAVAEVLQMIIILAISRPFSDAFELVRVIALPMIISTSCGCAIFMSIIRDQRDMYDTAAAAFSSKAFNIAERSLSLLSKGFNRQTADEMARIIYEETGVSAVAITDTEKVLSFIGLGSEHHIPDTPISSPLTMQAIKEKRVAFADGVQDRYTCFVSDTCPLNSVLVAPLTVDDVVIGTIKLYEARNKRFLNMNRSLGEGIAGLLSNQLLVSKYQQQKSLLIMSELKLLQAQINPHFLFNSLNTIIAILRKDADRARELLMSLSSFLRKNLKKTSELSTMEEELAHVNSYLAIEKARFEDKLTVEMNIDPTLFNLKIPAFTLQPIIENAIKHGIANSIGPGTARIQAYKENDVAKIEIEDNAGTFCENGHENGLGIKIVDRRLKLMMGENYGANVSCIPGELTRVTICVPLESHQYDSRIDRG